MFFSFFPSKIGKKVSFLTILCRGRIGRGLSFSATSQSLPKILRRFPLKLVLKINHMHSNSEMDTCIHGKRKTAETTMKGNCSCSLEWALSDHIDRSNRWGLGLIGLCSHMKDIKIKIHEKIPCATALPFSLLPTHTLFCALLISDKLQSISCDIVITLRAWSANPGHDECSVSSCTKYYRLQPPLYRVLEDSIY